MLRLLCRLVGFFLLVVAIAFLARDLYLASDTGQFAPAPLGWDWQVLSPGSLDLTQTVIQTRLWPPLWDGALQPILLVPSFIAIGILALLLLLLTHRRPRRHWP
jgi:hypothetical protein